MSPDVSILLLARDGIATLPALLDALDAQSSPYRVETVAVDSGSTDGTAQLLRRRVDRVVEIPAGSFNHGSTRNLGVGLCRGRYVVLLVQDAEPLGDGWLSALVGPLAGDEGLAGSFARQVPRAGASALTRLYLARWVAAAPEPRTTYLATPETFDDMSPMERFVASAFDNVCSCIRRSVWERIPFRETAIAEDVEWGRDVLLAGHGLAYVPEAAVVHSHDRPASYELGRTYLVHQRLRALFGLATIPDLASLALAVATTVPSHLRCVAAQGRLRELPRAVALGVALPLGQYLGVRSADTGRQWLRPRGI